MVDARGLACPMPVVMVQKAVKKSNPAELTVLVDNNALIDRYYLAEPGASYFLECDGQRFLFDTGFSGIFMDNAARMGIDLSNLNGVILSHGHNDHTWGLETLLKHYVLAGELPESPYHRHHTTFK